MKKVIDCTMKQPYVFVPPNNKIVSAAADESGLRVELARTLFRDAFDEKETQPESENTSAFLSGHFFVISIAVAETDLNCNCGEKSNAERELHNLLEKISLIIAPYAPIEIACSETISFLLKYYKDEVSDTDSYLNKYVEKLTEAVNSIFPDARIGIGGGAEGASEICECFRRSIFTLKVSKRLMPQEKTVYFRRLYTEYEMMSASKEEREKYYSSILGDLLLPENALWIETLDLFFETNKSAVDTAEKLYIHRNTLLFRFHKIERITGFNPQSFKDSIVLFEALAMWKLRDLSIEDLLTI